MTSEKAIVPTLSRLEDALGQIKAKANIISHFIAVKVSGRLPISRKQCLLNIHNMVIGVPEISFPGLPQDREAVDGRGPKRICGGYNVLVEKLQELSGAISSLRSQTWRYALLLEFSSAEKMRSQVFQFTAFMTVLDSQGLRVSAACNYARTLSASRVMRERQIPPKAGIF